MPKATKKKLISLPTSQKKTSTTAKSATSSTKTKSEALKPAVPVDDGVITVLMNEYDIKGLTDLLSVTAALYLELANQAVQLNDEQKLDILHSRYKLCVAYAEKMAAVHSMPEPISREFH